MEKDQLDLLSAFNEKKVRYLVVGGYAVSHFSEPRATKDLDIFIDSSDENAHRIYSALAAFGAPLGDVTPEDFRDGSSVYQIGQPPSRIDILQELTAIDFESAWNASVEGLAGTEIPVRYISADDLIKNKLALGRNRDLADVDAIRESQAARRNQPDSE